MVWAGSGIVLPITFRRTHPCREKTFRSSQVGPNRKGPGKSGHQLDSIFELERTGEQSVMTRFLSRQWLIGLVGLAALFISTTATAATDGTLGLNSIGTTDVSIVKGDTAQITGLQDIILVPWTVGDPAPAGTSPACVYTSTGSYQLTATSSNGLGAAYRMTDGANFLTYSVSWNDGPGGLQATTNGGVLAGLAGDAVSINCGGATPATVQVNISVGAMAGAPTGSFGDTLTVLIAPQ
jgi:hypothetical protein